MNGRQFIYHMQGLTKTYPPAKKVLENIHLSFYPDAKIGVLGVNGSGKSTLLRIMAGIDTEFSGEGWVAEGARVGYLEQEPQLDPNKTVRDNVMEGVAAKKALLDRYNEIAANYSDETADEMAKLQDEIDAKNLWDLDSQVDLAMDALRCPPDDADVDQAVGRRAAPRRAVPPAARCARPAAARRADQPPRRRMRQLAGRPSAQLPGRDPHRHPRPLLPRQRHRLDPRARPRPRHPVRGQLLLLAARRSKSAWSRKAARTRRAAARSSAKANGSRPRRRRGRRNRRRATSATRNCSRSPTPSRTRSAQIIIPVAERLGQNVVDFDRPEERLRRQSADRRSHLQAAARRHRRRHRPERRRQDDAVPHDHRPGEARRRHDQDRRVGAARLCRPVARLRSTARRTCGRKFPTAWTSSCSASSEMNSRAYCLGCSTSRAPTSRRRSARCRAASATACISPRCCASGANLLLLDEPTNDLDVDTLAGARRGAGGFRRLRRDHQPRPLVPRPHRHPHARLRGRQPRRMVRGQLPGLRGRQDAPPGAGTQSFRTG